MLTDAVTYVVHDYAGRQDEHRTFTVDGYLAHVLRTEYHTAEQQRQIGITVLPDNWTVDTDNTQEMTA